jgi:high-affinity K+ transport system ATPase subunit B
MGIRTVMITGDNPSRRRRVRAGVDDFLAGRRPRQMALIKRAGGRAARGDDGRRHE